MQKNITQLAPLPVLVAPLIVSGIPLLMVQFFPQYLYRTMDVPAYLVFHNVAEFFSIMVSLSIFGIGWYSYDQSKNSHALFLSIAFLAIGLMDFMHSLSYAGMPALITPNSANKSTQFWIAARLFAAVTFFISAYVYPDTDSRWPSRTVLLLSALSISGLVFVGVTFFPSRLPATFVEGVGLTPFKKFSEYVVITVLSFATLAYWMRFSRTRQRLLLYFIAALIICIFSEFAFAIYESVFDIFNVIGHTYKIAAFYLMYRGIFSASVKAPYLSLSEISEKLAAENAQRRRVEDELKSSLKQLKGLALRDEMILNSAGEGIYGTDINGAIVFMNPAAQNMLGFTMNDVIGQNSHQLFHHTKADGSPYPVEECPLHKSINNGKTRREVDEVFWTRDGRKFPVEHVNTPLLNSGIVVGSVVVFRDVTAQRKMMDAEVARMRAEAASKAKSDFLANMSHELRTPLTSIIGFSEVIQDGMTGPLSQEQEKYLEYIHGSGKHLLSLINDILDLSKIEAGKLELDLTSVSVAYVLNSALIMQKEKAMTHDIRVDLEISPDADIEITADQRKLKQIVFNLLNNALKFTKDRGAVLVRAQRTDRNIGGEMVDCIEISVKDTGMGIKAEDMTRLFVEFTQLQSPGTKEYEGTGLGLALSKKLVELHGGKIWAESRFGKGSKFTFAIPVVIPIGAMKKDNGKT